MVADNVEEDDKSFWKGSDDNTNFTDGCSTSPSGFSNSQEGCTTSPSEFSESLGAGASTNLTSDTGTVSRGIDGSTADRDFASAFSDINDETFFSEDDDAGSSVQTPSVGSFSVQTPSLQSMNTMPTDVQKIYGSLVGANSKAVDETIGSATDNGRPPDAIDVSTSQDNETIDDDDTFSHYGGVDNDQFIKNFNDESENIVRKRSMGLASVMSRKTSYNPHSGSQGLKSRVPSNIIPPTATKSFTAAKPPISPAKSSRTSSRTSSRMPSREPSKQSSRISSKVSNGFRSRSARSITPGRRSLSKSSSYNSLSRLNRSKSKAEAKLSGDKSFSSQSGRKLSSSAPRGRSKSVDKKDSGHTKSNKRRSLFRSRSRSSFSSHDSQTHSTDEMTNSRDEESVDMSVQASTVGCEATAVLSRDSTNALSATALDNHVGQAPVVTYASGFMRLITKGPKSMLNMNVSKQDIRLRQKAERLLINQEYEDLATLVQQHPKLVRMQASQPLGRTLLHMIANESNPVPENILLKIISHDASVVSMTDNSTNIPLHYAASRLRRDNMHVFVIFLKFHPSGAAEKNAEGDLPLHLAAGNPTRCAHEAIHLLLEMNSKGITQPNKNGKIPLHLALADGSNNPKNMQTLVQFHKYRKAGVSVLDNKGMPITE